MPDVRHRCLVNQRSVFRALAPGALLALAAAAPNVAAGEEVLIRGALPEAVVSTADVRTEIAAAPPEEQLRLTGDPQTLAETIDAIYRRKAAVAAALAEGLDREADVQALIARAREQVLADQLTERKRRELTARIPDMTARAQELYQSRRERMVVPERVKARHILLRADSDEARAKRQTQADDILKRLREGADFAALAKETSDDQGSAAGGGELPPFTRGQMVKPFEDAAFALKDPGELSPIVTTQFGLHIIQLQEHQPQRQRSFDEVKPSIVANLRQNWVTQALETWRQGIVDPSKVTVDKKAVDIFVKEVTGKDATPAPAESKPQADPKP